MTTDRAKRYKANAAAFLAGFIGSVTGTLKRSPESEACRCGGNCPCHVLMQLGGETCPPACPRFGKQFDGCHRCDDGHN